MVSCYPPRIEPSATIQMGDKARELNNQGVDVINFGSGSPDFTTPEHIRKEAQAALEAGHTQMGVTPGLLELRDAIIDKFERDNEIQATRDTVGVTPGSKNALFLALLALLRDGDEVALLDPSWVSYEAMVTLAGGTTNRVTLDPETGFSLGSVDLSEALSPETHALILNNPSNPTGAVFTKSELKEIRDLAIDYDFWVVTDEIYEKLVYSGTHHSIGALDGMDDRTITTNGFSKAYAMSGWRLGYYTGPAAIVDAMQSLQSQTVSAPTIFAQHGAVQALEGPQEAVGDMRDTYYERIQTALDILEEAGVTLPAPQGAFYLFIPVENPDDVALAESLLDDHHVAVTPGSAFGVPGYIRVACTIPEDRVKTGMDRIKSYCRSEP